MDLSFENNPKGMTYFVIIVCCLVFILVMIIVWFFTKNKNQKGNQCTSITHRLSKFPNIRPISITDEQCTYTLKNYYIKSSYNSCCVGAFERDYVDLCSLKAVLKQGCRAIDVEIFTIDGKAQVSCSTSNNVFSKSAFNSIPFSDFMTVLQSYGFSSSHTPNPTDPILLHLRCKTDIKETYDQMAITLKSFENYLLGPKYSYEANGTNLGDAPLMDLCGKIAIIADKMNPTFIETKFNEYVNLSSSSIFCRNLFYKDVKYAPNSSELTLYNKTNMTFCLPDQHLSQPPNPSGILARELGVQFVSMCYQNDDIFLEENEQFFNEKSYAFVLKPEELRNIPVVIPDAPEQKKELSYADRTIKSDLYSFKI